MALLTLSRGDHRLVGLPTSWSNRGRHEQLQRGAAESFSNLVALAVAKSGSNFQLYDAHRSLEEQIELLERNYRRVSRGRYKSSDRTWDGSTWEKRPGRPNTASPGWSNHGSGLAVDIHPGPIQDIFKTEGLAWGWSWDEGRENGEDWHFVYVGGNRYASRGWLDHAAVQRAVGADVDGKIGTGTVAKIRAWQTAHGLEADGIVGPGTKAAMLGGAVADIVEDVVEAVADAVLRPAESLTIQEAGPAVNAYADRKGHSIKHATIHWWGRPAGQTFEGIRDYLIDNPREVSAHYVVSSTQVAEILPEEQGAWGNGDRTANLEGIVIECDPNKVLESLPTIAALLADIFGRRGDLDVYPHNHWTNTECPGDYEPYLPALVDAARTGKAPLITPAAPAAPTILPTGKALLVKLTDLPDFPLLRTPGNLCYYGQADGPITSVSGKNSNSLNPGEIFGSGRNSGAHGLKRWQAQAGIEADGRFGNGTEAKVRDVQKRAGLKVDGLLGPSTWYANWLVI